MKFSYTYRSSDGEMHMGEMSAPEREDVFTRLRAQGIRPIKVLPVEDGSTPLRRRFPVVVISLLVLVVLGLLALLLNSRRAAPTVPHPQSADPSPQAPISAAKSVKRAVIESPAVEVKLGPRVAKARARKQVAGLPGTPKELCAMFNRVFTHPSESWLARFAQPGLTIPGSKEEDVQGVLEEDLTDALEDAIIIDPSDPQEVVEVKRIVTGLKEEISLLLTSGKSIIDARKWLEGRQRMESDYRHTILRRVSDGDLASPEADQLLLSMGFAPTRKPGSTPTSSQK